MKVKNNNLDFVSKIHNLLESEVKGKKVKKRQFRVFAYNTIFNIETLVKLKSIEISPERALFPSMNPNLFGGLPSIFSCKPNLRVSLNPRDVIFCFPRKSNKHEKYFTFKRQELPVRCLTLIMIIIKKVELQQAFDFLNFKSCNKYHEVVYNENFEYFPFSPFPSDLIQSGDITARYREGMWEYAGYGHGVHNRNASNIKSLNDADCLYKSYLKENRVPFPKLGCENSFKCVHYKKTCNMKSGNWKYDILFKWGLMGSLKKSIPLDYRSFYLGSKGLTLEEFADKLNCKEIKANPRHIKNDVLNEKGPELLNNLREAYGIK